MGIEFVFILPVFYYITQFYPWRETSLKPIFNYFFLALLVVFTASYLMVPRLGFGVELLENVTLSASFIRSVDPYDILLFLIKTLSIVTLLVSRKEDIKYTLLIYSVSCLTSVLRAEHLTLALLEMAFLVTLLRSEHIKVSLSFNFFTTFLLVSLFFSKGKIIESNLFMIEVSTLLNTLHVLLLLSIVTKGYHLIKQINSSKSFHNYILFILLFEPYLRLLSESKLTLGFEYKSFLLYISIACLAIIFMFTSKLSILRKHVVVCLGSLILVTFLGLKNGEALRALFLCHLSINVLGYYLNIKEGGRFFKMVVFGYPVGTFWHGVIILLGSISYLNLVASLALTFSILFYLRPGRETPKKHQALEKKKGVAFLIPAANMLIIYIVFLISDIGYFA